jgi:hypothetical protein
MGTGWSTEAAAARGAFGLNSFESGWEDENSSASLSMVRCHLAQVPEQNYSTQEFVKSDASFKTELIAIRAFPSRICGADLINQSSTGGEEFNAVPAATGRTLAGDEIFGPEISSWGG